MFSFNTPNISQQFHTGILINQHITVQAAAEVILAITSSTFGDYCVLENWKGSK